MASTVELSVGPDDWTRIAEGMGTVAIQMARKGQFQLYVGDLAPNSSSPGIVIGDNIDGIPTSFSGTNLPETAFICVKSSLEKPANIIVLSY